jgi:hypothetical protein
MGLFSVVAVVLALTMTGCAAKELPFQAEGTRGQVGHHMTADLVLDERAAGCGGHAGGSALVSGKTLPPGIRQSGLNDWYFEGTPTQPGHWRTDVTLIDLECDGPRPDQIVPIDFDIAP